MRAVTVCVEFSDLLAISLPRAAPHFESVLVISTPEDTETAAVVATVSNAVLFTTDAFYRDGAAFRKGLALEEGLDFFDRFRPGWMAVMDCDVVVPPDLGEKLAQLPPGYIFSPRRKMLADPRQFSDDLNWRTLPTKHDEECAGYFQFFHTRDPVLPELPWYGTDWVSAGGPDSDMAARWSIRRRIKLRWNVLHLGEDNVNWCGRTAPYLDGRLPEKAAERTARLTELMQRRHESGGRHEHEKLREP